MLTKTQKIVRWASEKKERGFAHALTELNQTEHSFLFMLNRLHRRGIIKFNVDGRRVALHLTRDAYYNRSSLVVVR